MISILFLFIVIYFTEYRVGWGKFGWSLMECNGIAGFDSIELGFRIVRACLNYYFTSVSVAFERWEIQRYSNE